MIKRGFCEIINSGIHPYQNLIMFEMVEKYVEKFDRVEFVNSMLKNEFQSKNFDNFQHLRKF